MTISILFKNIRAFGEGNGNPLQYPCLENPTDGESHGWRSLAGYSLCDRKQSDTARSLTHTHTHTLVLLLEYNIYIPENLALYKIIH